MSTGETLITLGALTLLVISILNMNRTLNTTDSFMNETRFGLEKLALATSLIEEISQFPFDEASWDTTDVEKVPGDFTASADLGPEADETSYTLFDDVDDFHNYTKLDTTQQNIYNISCTVNYVEADQPSAPVSTRSYYKKISIKVFSGLDTDTIKVDYIHGFWYFN